jgi:TolB protein
MSFRAIGLLMFGVLALAVPARRPVSADDVRVDISSGQGRRIRIHCEAMTSSSRGRGGPSSVDADEVLASDLDHSAVFTVSRSWVANEQPFDVQAFVGGKWNVSGSQVQLTGQVLDFPARRPILVRDYRGPANQWRALVHRFADDVVQQFTGELGVSETRIAFVAREGRDKELYVMDADGAGVMQLTRDHSIALSPAFSPEGSLLLFTTYRGGAGPQINVVSSQGGKEYLVSGRKGNNTSASYSPDGRDIACTLSIDGNPEIYPARRARRQPTAADHEPRDRHLAGVVADGARDRVHVRPQRLAAGLRDGPRWW